MVRFEIRSLKMREIMPGAVSTIVERTVDAGRVLVR